MEQHYREVENMYRQMRGWRHDYHNHIQTMKAYLSMGQADKLSDSLASLDQDLTNVDTVVKTGNVMVDAILNSKLSMAQAKGRGGRAGCAHRRDGPLRDPWKSARCRRAGYCALQGF